MGDDQVVARELEQAEARLEELRSIHLEWLTPETLDPHTAAAIEVGRLQVLAELESRRSRRLTWEEAERVESALAALAAREEVQK